jgi:hypothetical protein
MAVAQRLSNGYVVLLMTPREATMLSDAVLDPGEFPWQRSESQMVSVEIQSILRKLVAEDAVGRLDEANRTLEYVKQEEKERREFEEAQRRMIEQAQAEQDQQDKKNQKKQDKSA